jgi:protein-tyrosine phosphatase
MLDARQFILKQHDSKGAGGLILFKRKTKVLFVCTENICRSPLAEGLLRHHLREAGLGSSVKVASAGTRVSMKGAPPDHRAEKIAAETGVRLGRLRARRVTPEDIEDNDFIFAMDHQNLEELMCVAPPEHQHKISLLLAHRSGGPASDVPDPYYGSMDNFREVYGIIEDAVVSIMPLVSSTP